MSFTTIFQQLLNTSSTKEKEKILTEALQSEYQNIIYILFDLANNYKINTYLTDIKVLGQTFKPQNNEFGYDLRITSEDSSITKFKTIYSYLKSGNRYSKKDWVALLQDLSNVSSSEEFNWYIKAITKDLVCGASLKIFNKALKVSGNDFNLIPEWGCMKVSSIEECKVNPEGSYVSLKKDGVNLTAIYLNNKWEFYTRAGQSIYLPHVQEALEEIINEFPTIKELVIFGELICSTRQATSGLVTSSIKLREDSKLPIEDLNLHIFDAIKLSEYESILKEVSTNKITPFSERLKLIQQIKECLDFYLNRQPIKIIEHILVNSVEEVYEYYNKWTSEDENCEGIIWNDKDGYFEFKRSKKRARIKAELEADFVITNWELLKDKQDWIGSLQVQTSCGKLVASVGTGLKEKDRKDLFIKAKEDSLVGLIAKVKYNKVIPHSTEEGKKTLFLPVFLELRETYDKSTADSIKEIKHY